MLKHYGFIVQFILLFGCTTSHSMEACYNTEHAYTNEEISNNNNSTSNVFKDDNNNIYESQADPKITNDLAQLNCFFTEWNNNTV